MKKYLSFLVFVTLLIINFGCNENEEITNPKNIFPADSVIVPFSPIDTKIILKLFEEINPANRNVVLFCYTEQTYSPAGSKIISTITQIADTFKIDFQELYISTIGAAIFTPATVNFDLNAIQNGSYILDIKINTKKVLGLITVTDELFGLEIQPNNIIYSYQEEIHRIPRTTIWGQAESIQPTPFQLFLDSLVILGAQSHNLQAGDYHYFEVDSQGGFNIKSALGMAYGKHFLYNFEGDTLITRNLVKRFAKRYLDSIYIQLFGGRGEMYFSTVLKNEPW
jgi:hypothetical protein